ncbi:MAG: ABC 3 transport family [Candidatus Syntrophoarchaeum caldarius]|uniref:ABC 3 transport family n=1 Tax=Candidatus Syntropharchaeum caldarium TaxID=1838285 RepID=A0A1F2P9X1_9EURY|nr:MAG: ABC 3 transport family [Candidatus Syntrophoarchaeum caldarius]
MIEILQYEYVQNALMATLLVSIACGIVGTYVVINRIVFISGGISHTAFGGIGLGYLIGVSPIITAIPFSIIAAIGIGLISKEAEVSEDTAIGILWTMGMALGIIFIGLSPGYAPDLIGYLFGNILTVPSFDLIIMLVLDLVIILLVILFYREFLAISFDEDFAEVVGIPTRWFYLLLLSLIALSVVVLVRVVGIILVIALLTIPAAICGQFTHNIRKMMLLSVAISVILTTTGFLLSYYLDLASGATIIMVLGIAFIISSLIKKGRYFSS